jgi:hypothetical protein
MTADQDTGKQSLSSAKPFSVMAAVKIALPSSMTEKR